MRDPGEAQQGERCWGVFYKAVKKLQCQIAPLEIIIIIIIINNNNHYFLMHLTQDSWIWARPVFVSHLLRNKD